MKTITDIDIVRHNTYYFYNLRRDGHTVVNSEQIGRDRARQIYEANQDQAQQRTKGVVSFDAAPCEWSWTVRIVEEAAHVN